MKLDRHNYEEYFILYLDNELSEDERRQVETFASENPDLKAELDMLLQTKLSPDTDINFPNKESLLVADNNAINIDNYQEWLLSYIDNELPAADVKEVESFIAQNSAAARELALLQRVKLQPEAIVFPDKNSLYRKEETKVIAIRWWRIAVAAALLLAIATTSVLVINKRNAGDSQGVARNAPKNVQQPSVEKATSPKENISTQSVNEEEQLATSTDEEINNGQLKAEKEGRSQLAVSQEKRTNPTVRKEEKVRPAVDVRDEVIASKDVNNNVKNRNGLPTPEENPNVIPNLKVKDEVIAKNDVTPPAELTNSTKKMDAVVVTGGPAESLDPIEQPEGKKNKLRGFFRKVTRTFEKRTNMKATDDDDRLLIAGLAIKLN